MDYEFLYKSEKTFHNNYAFILLFIELFIRVLNNSLYLKLNLEFKLVRSDKFCKKKCLYFRV